MNAQAILVDGDPRLRTPSSPVVRIDCDEIARLVGALADARRRLGFGRAIAAPQIGVMKRMIAIDLGAGPFVVVNPEIVWRSDETREVWDDCFSVPDRLARVRRHVSISLRFQDGEMRARSWERLRPDDAELLQHEIDHLDGVLMLDRAEEVVPATPRGRREEPRLSLARIREASEHVDPVFLRTPQFVCEPLADALGCRLVLKVETANPIRCFKGRGAEYFVGKRGAEAPFVCASAGNFGQAMAYACRARGIGLTVFAAHGANLLKLARIRALGAELRVAGADFDAAKDEARAFAASSGARFVEDGEEAEITEGAGTIGLELAAGREALDAVVLPLGNGALVNGVARWMKAASPMTRVIGVVSRSAPAMAESWQKGALVVHPHVDTIADGIAVRVPIAAALSDMQELVDDVVLVDDADLVRAMGLVKVHAGLVGEPAGVAGIAAILAEPRAFAGLTVATVLAGSNVIEEGGPV